MVDQDDDFGLAAPIAEVWPVISQAGLAWMLAQHGDAEGCIPSFLSDMARQGRALKATDYIEALDKVRNVSRMFGDLFARYDLLLTPTTAAMPWSATASTRSASGSHRAKAVAP